MKIFVGEGIAVDVYIEGLFVCDSQFFPNSDNEA